ncbi:TPA: hypothetical protein RJR39_003574 [Burkholderia cenocepacia]|nr:hypothetical protein [Burkholderia cenocepacia]MBR8196343.1 hypothetical protein [Burkholderia cenocepacia]HDV6327481.1 hypothetical protein [Burkholderia cenocepacia]HDV6351353.1 hypothetical protein [Burkholderia cenocepacia]
MKSFLRKVGELIGLWFVVATILFVFVWLVVPALISAPDDGPVIVPTRPS